MGLYHDLTSRDKPAKQKPPLAADKGETAIKFSPDGRVLMTLGKAGVAGDVPACSTGPPTSWSRRTAVTAFIGAPSPDFEMPEGVAADKDGNVYGGFTAKNDVKKYVKN